MDLGLTNSRVVILGGGGLGGACARGFLAAGARVAVIDHNQAGLDQLAGQAQSASLATIAGDAASEHSCVKLVEDAGAALGGLDVFVHALGVNLRKPFMEFTAEDWHRIIRLNLDTAFWATQAAGRLLSDGGRVVLFSSVAGTLGHKNHAPYAATKGGINQLTKVLAHEWATRGIGVNAVAPGYVETNLTRSHLDKPGIRDGLEALVPAGRLGVPEEVVGPVLFLSSRLASFVTGQILHVDGGRTVV